MYFFKPENSNIMLQENSKNAAHLWMINLGCLLLLALLPTYWIFCSEHILLLEYKKIINFFR